MFLKSFCSVPNMTIIKTISVFIYKHTAVCFFDLPSKWKTFFFLRMHDDIYYI